MENISPYFVLSNLGKIVKLKLNFDGNLDEILKKYQWVKYNPRGNKRHIQRFGISITSIDGKNYDYTTPDLDSIFEYNRENNTEYTSFSFKEKTPLWYDLNLDSYFQQISDEVKRSHLIKLPPGGYFPYHRDGVVLENLTFRIILTLKNCNRNCFCFVLDNEVMDLKNNCFYFFNTRLEHFVANISAMMNHDVIFGVFTIPLNEKTVSWLIKNLEIN